MVGVGRFELPTPLLPKKACKAVKIEAGSDL
jgi:hypothetical protein